ncbi:MAG: DUF4013 domain-containing protein [Methanobacteriota archaeon]
MDMRIALNDSFAYAKESVWGQWKRWIILTIMSIIFPFILGYMMEIYRGITPPPEPENWGQLFVDGLKFLLVAIIYAIPVIIILVASFFPVMLSIFSKIGAGGEFTMDLSGLAPFFLPVFGGLLLAFIMGVAITLISTIGIVRMARVGGIGEAFNFSAIFETIRAIGWVSYIFALIVLGVVVIVVSFIFSLAEVIPYLGFIITLFLGVILTVFEARFLTLLYESSEY